MKLKLLKKFSHFLPLTNQRHYLLRFQVKYRNLVKYRNFCNAVSISVIPEPYVQSDALRKSRDMTCLGVPVIRGSDARNIFSFRDLFLANKVGKYSQLFISIFHILNLLTPWWCQASCGLEKRQPPRHEDQTDYWKVRSR